MAPSELTMSVALDMEQAVALVQGIRQLADGTAHRQMTSQDRLNAIHQLAVEILEKHVKEKTEAASWMQRTFEAGRMDADEARAVQALETVKEEATTDRAEQMVRLLQSIERQGRVAQEQRAAMAAALCSGPELMASFSAMPEVGDTRTNEKGEQETCVKVDYARRKAWWAPE